MRMLHVLLPMLVWMSDEGIAQSVAVATPAGPTPIIDSAPAAPQAANVAGCGVWREPCAGDDRNKMLLLLGVMSVTKLPLPTR